MFFTSSNCCLVFLSFSLRKSQGTSRLVAGGAAGAADLPGKVAKEQKGDCLHQQVKLRDSGKKPGKAKPAGNRQAAGSSCDAKNMRQRAAEAECCPRRGQHDVVRTRREGCRGGEDHKSQNGSTVHVRSIHHAD